MIHAVLADELVSGQFLCVFPLTYLVLWRCWHW